MRLLNYSVTTLLVALFVCVSMNTQAQESTKPDSVLVTTFINPGHMYRVRINGVLQEETNQFLLASGTYQFSFWAPNYERFDTSLTVADTPIRFLYELEKTQELITYEKDFEHFKRKRGRVVLGIGATAVVGIGALINNQRIGNLNLDQIKAENGYTYNVDGFTKSNLDDANQSLDNAKNLQYGIYAAGALTLGYTVISYIKFKKLEKPTLKEDRSFILDDIGMVYNPVFQNYYPQVTFKF